MAVMVLMMVSAAKLVAVAVTVSAAVARAVAVAGAVWRAVARAVARAVVRVVARAVARAVALAVVVAVVVTVAVVVVVTTVAVGRQLCVGERAKNVRGKGGQDKSPCCVSWADETPALSCKKTGQGPTLHHANTSLEGVQKQNHVAKGRRQKTQKIRENAHMAKRYARNKGESNQVSTR